MIGPDLPHPSRVRPYALTGGRVRGPVDLPVEAVVRTTATGLAAADRSGRGGPERRRIVALCREPLSVAEVAARLGLHLQATRVLIGDLVHDGHVEITGTPTAVAPSADLRLLERVLDGLQSL